MAYKITKKITPNPVPGEAYADIAAWHTVNSPCHGSEAPAVQVKEWTLHSDGKSAIVALTYEEKDTCDRHHLTEPEDYSDQFDVVIESQGEV